MSSLLTHVQAAEITKTDLVTNVCLTFSLVLWHFGRLCRVKVIRLNECLCTADVYGIIAHHTRAHKLSRSHAEAQAPGCKACSYTAKL